uniref:Uncharacterized protein n=1 Tax=Rhizophora mucronata TaxID=61149 RepID=A0A2P2JP78_RHIMU
MPFHLITLPGIYAKCMKLLIKFPLLWFSITDIRIIFACSLNVRNLAS